MGLLALVRSTSGALAGLNKGFAALPQTATASIEQARAEIEAAKSELSNELKDIFNEVSKYSMDRPLGTTKSEKGKGAKQPVEVLKPGEWRDKWGGSEGVSATGGQQWVPWGEALTPEQLAQMGHQFDVSIAAAFTKQLEELTTRMTALLGKDSYFAQMLAVELPYLKSGARSADEAKAFLRNFLQWAEPGLKRQLADPTTPGQLRILLEELIRLGESGQLVDNSKFAGQLDDVKRALDEQKRQDEIRDLLNTDRHGMTKAQLDELDKKIKDLQNQGQQASVQAEANTKTFESSISKVSTQTELISSNLKGVSGQMNSLQNGQAALTATTNEIAQEMKNVTASVGQATHEIATTAQQTKSALENNILWLEKLISQGKDFNGDLMRQLRAILETLGNVILSPGYHSPEIDRLNSELEQWLASH